MNQTITNKVNPDDDGTTVTTTDEETTIVETSPEDKFFGVKTSIEDMTAPVEIEVKTEVQVEALKAEDEKEQAAKDVDTYGPKVEKRIAHLTWQAKEAERERDAATSMRDEAVNYARSVNQQNQHQAHIISTGEAHLVERIKAAAKTSVEASRIKYKAAYEEGDSEKIVVAQEELIRAQADDLAAKNYDADYQQSVTDWTNQQQYNQRQAYLRAQQPQPQQVAAPPRPTPQSDNWAEKNPWFHNPKHRDMQAIAYATHETLLRDDGVKLDSPEYYEAIDTKVRHHFPEYFSAETQKKPTTVVAPGSRNNGTKSRQVHLAPEEVALAKTLGVSLELYAQQKGALQ